MDEVERERALERQNQEGLSPNEDLNAAFLTADDSGVDSSDGTILSALNTPGSNGIVTARGTLEGVVLRLDGRVSSSEVKQGIIEFLSSRRGFLGGNEVVLEWLGKLPAQPLIEEIKALLLSEFSISVKSSTEAPLAKATPPRVQNEERGSEERFRDQSEPLINANRASLSNVVNSKSAKVAPIRKTWGRAPSLFDGIEVLGEGSVGREGKERMSDRGFSGDEGGDLERSNPAFDSSLWDDPDARVIYATIRSGQKIETEHTLVVFGDVNSGAELVAGGDIIVLGTLRGTAHAGAYDETGGGRVIFSLNLQPTQLRIGSIISRGSSDCSGVAEIARVEGTLIVVESYSSRGGAPSSRQGGSAQVGAAKKAKQNIKGSAHRIR